MIASACTSPISTDSCLSTWINLPRPSIHDPHQDRRYQAVFFSLQVRQQLQRTEQVLTLTLWCSTCTKSVCIVRDAPCPVSPALCCDLSTCSGRRKPRASNCTASFSCHTCPAEPHYMKCSNGNLLLCGHTVEQRDSAFGRSYRGHRWRRNHLQEIRAFQQDRQNHRFLSACRMLSCSLTLSHAHVFVSFFPSI